MKGLDIGKRTRRMGGCGLQQNTAEHRGKRRLPRERHSKHLSVKKPDPTTKS